MPRDTALNFLVEHKARDFKLTTSIINWLGEQDQPVRWQYMSDDERRRQYRKAAEICLSCDDLHCDDLVNIMIGLAAFDPASASVCIDEFITPLWQSPNAMTLHYCCGVVIGLFNVAIWLETHWRQSDKIAKLDAAMPDLVTRYITSPVLQYGSGRIMDQTAWAAFDIEFPIDAVLGEAIKSYCRAELKFGGQGRRIYAVHTTIQQVHTQLNQRGDEQLSPLVTLVLDQLAYAEFGRLSSLIRLSVLHTWFESTIQRIIGAPAAGD